MSTLTITRVTHACVLLDFGNVRLLTDPWFSERRGYYRGEPLGINLEDLPQLSGVLVSHEHYDHYDMDTFKTYPNKNIPIIIKRGIANKAYNAGFTNIIELDPWEQTQIDNVQIIATPARHKVPENTYIIKTAEYTIFFGADTLAIPELSQVAKHFPDIDVALLPVNGLTIRPLFNKQVVMSAKEAAQLCNVLHPRIAIPIHYRFTGGWLRDRLLLKYNGTAETFYDYTKQYAPNTEVHILAPGEPLTIFPISK